MRPRHHDYTIQPSVIPTGCVSTVRIVPCFTHCPLSPPRSRPVTVIGMCSGREEDIVATSDGDALILGVHPHTEEELCVLIRPVDGGPPVEEFRLYAADADLMALRPWRVDLHCHSRHSDGKEDPSYVAAAYREAGFDGVALTDHRRYAPSIEMIAAYADVVTDLAMYPGEEIHAPGNPVHILGIGGRTSVNEEFADDPEAHGTLIRALAQDAPAALNDNDRYAFASCRWVVERIRAAGGLSVFCHPYWITGCRYNVSTALQDALFEDAGFDAYELIGGFHRHQQESNSLQVARYLDCCVRGRDMPVLGVSDSHGTTGHDLFGWYWTMVFAASPSLEDLLDAVRARRCVAVESVPGEAVRIYGDLRWATVAHFAQRELFPEHDALCRTEGQWMREFAGGNPDAPHELARLSGRVRTYLDQHWGSPPRTAGR